MNLERVNTEWLNLERLDPDCDSAPSGTQPQVKLNPKWNSTPSGTQPPTATQPPTGTQPRQGLNLEFLSTSNDTISSSKYKIFTVFFEHESRCTYIKRMYLKKETKSA